MKGNHVSIVRTGLCAGLYALALFGVSVAQAAGHPYTSSGNKATFTAVPVTESNIGNFTMRFASDGTPIMRSSPSLNLPGGATVPVNVDGPMNKMSMGRALAKFTMRIAWPLTLGMEAHTLLQDLGHTAVYDPVKKEQVILVPDWEKSCDFTGKEVFTNPTAWCSSYNGRPVTGTTYFGTQQCQVAADCSGDALDSPWYWGTPFPTQVTRRLSETELADEIAKKSGWPTSSRLAMETLVRDAVKAGNKIDTETPTVTGPATKTGPTTTTTDSTGKTVINTSTTTLTYTDNSVTYNTTNTTQTTNPDGTTVTGTTTVADPVSEDPKDPCQANPNRIGCAEMDTPDGEIPREDRTITYEAENLFGDGGCPADLHASLGTLGTTVKVWDWQKTCAYAIPLRAIVIALASFAAFIIVMPDGRVAP